MTRDADASGLGARHSRALWIAAAIALAHTAWAVFQWYQLVIARRGGEIFCGPGGGDCAEVWDSPFASAVHAQTGLPVAAWGVAWGLAALAFPLLALWTRATSLWLAGTAAVAVGGALGVVGLVTASALFGHFCTTCAVTYVLVLAYAGVCLFGIGIPAVSELARGGALAVGALAIAVAVLFVPGTQTPKSLAATGAKAMESAQTPPGNTPDDKEIARFISSLPDDGKQLLSDTLSAYSAGSQLLLPKSRATIGPYGARLQITEFSDTLCGHCAQLHEILKQLRVRFGPAAFSLSAHQYPLDPACNKGIQRQEGEPVAESEPLRCLAARVQICAEGAPNAFEFVGSLFENQQSLTEEKLWELTGALGQTRADLEACAKSPETEKKLQDDIAWAMAHGIQGTPLLVVNGRQAVPFPPLLYVLTLTKGAASHPSYVGLPPAKPLPWAKGH